MGRRHDTLDDLRRRRDSWAKYIDTRSEFAKVAPRIVAELNKEIEYLEAPERADDVIPLTAYERRVLLQTKGNTDAT